jgi:uncharacterized protein with HEPN domain
VTRSAAERAADILEAIERCQTYRAHLTDSDPEIVQMAFDAALRNLAVIGEAANHLPPDFTAAHPDIPWKSIVGMRHILVHQYFDVDPSIVTDALDEDLLPLVTVLAETR